MTFPSQPRFSVVIPAFNEAGYLAGALGSLARQDFTGAYEVIVVDNNSTDETARIAESFGARVVKEPRPGVCHARQAGTENSRGEIVVSTDADTTFPVSWLSTIDQAFSAHPSCVAVGGPCTFTDAPWWGTIYSRVLFNIVYFVALVSGRVFYITATNISFKKAAWDGYDTRLTQGGDELDLLRRLRRRGKVIFLPGNPTMTSARRLQRGLAYNVFISFLYYYVLAYLVNRLFRRTLLCTAPVFRTEKAATRVFPKIRLRVVLSGLCVLVAMAAPPLGREIEPGLEVTFNVLQRLY
jgi:glycosyltransferase involved in cell wall biosynthesis